MPRLFIAIDLPEEQARVLTSLRDDALGARWTPPDQLHITLRFVGDADAEVTEALSDTLRSVEAPSFTLSGGGLDVFPSRRRPRVLVARLRKTPALMVLQEQIDQIVQAHGVEADPKPFNPHVTFGRVKGANPREVRRFMKETTGVDIEPFRVTAFHLYRSDLKPGGAEHSILASYELA